MAYKKLIVILLLFSFLLISLVSQTAFAGGNSGSGQSTEINKVLNKKEEKILEKFQNAKEWVEIQKSGINQWFKDWKSSYDKLIAGWIKKIRDQINRIYDDLAAKFEEFRNKHYKVVDLSALSQRDYMMAAEPLDAI